MVIVYQHKIIVSRGDSGGGGLSSTDCVVHELLRWSSLLFFPIIIGGQVAMTTNKLTTSRDESILKVEKKLNGLNVFIFLHATYYYY